MNFKKIWDQLRQYSFDELKEHAAEAVKDVIEGAVDDEHDIDPEGGHCLKCGATAPTGKCTFQGFSNPPPPLRKPKP